MQFETDAKATWKVNILEVHLNLHISTKLTVIKFNSQFNLNFISENASQSHSSKTFTGEQ